MYRPPADLFRNRISGGDLISSRNPPGAIFRPADLFRDTGHIPYLFSINLF